jgi:hypothetical protein
MKKPVAVTIGIGKHYAYAQKSAEYVRKHLGLETRIITDEHLHLALICRHLTKRYGRLNTRFGKYFPTLISSCTTIATGGQYGISTLWISCPTQMTFTFAVTETTTIPKVLKKATGLSLQPILMVAYFLPIENTNQSSITHIEITIGTFQLGATNAYQIK